MKMEGLILDVSDITQETKVDRNGEQKLNGKLRLITTNPTDTIEVRVAPELWGGGKAGEVLKQCVGSRMMFDVEYKQFSFANDDGKHVSMQGFHLYALPVLNNK
ncbi:chemotaxis protein [Vibrio parahaemolyticus]|uniref:chemotaxis protein n=1 Tax=Vibrio parahaemolyticus TaxID=670 RepID=UPI00193CAD86|nr:chemotaxis protein [Vibrio parahaemolyticus]ELA7321610.1 chemotaxis protein [Vibrio parahaemolyticus]ELA8116717.1 chemotaxis protein [Vibrio parahaemolyticus]MBM5014484.1 chemotaxis protein [Vibrio parahaemolyticus]MBM5127545.1 chemotaxis protein [Vibrio parahaemolyticus]MCF9106734.1 chemotaxis protein [Vibrio parahaemolyticus]